jgi:hypothetical protein
MIGIAVFPKQYKRWYKMYEKYTKLLPDGESRSKSIECEHAYKKNSQNTDHPRQPMDKFDFWIHFEY